MNSYVETANEAAQFQHQAIPQIESAQLDENLEAEDSQSKQFKSFGNIANQSPQVQYLTQLQSFANGGESTAAPIQQPKNETGLPDQLKSGIENLGGFAMDDVKVHYNSSKPAQLQAHAYAQGTEIHIAPGQEKHLAHEAWHVVQQKQGRVKPTLQLKGIAINDDSALETEADVMGEKAMGAAVQGKMKQSAEANSFGANPAIQRVVLSKVYTKTKKAGGGFLDRFYSSHDGSKEFATFEEAAEYDAEFEDEFDSEERYPTNFSYYNQRATSVATGLQGPHSLSHTSLAYRLNLKLEAATFDDVAAIRALVAEQVPSIGAFRTILDREKPRGMKDDQYRRTLLDYELLLNQLEQTMALRASFNRDRVHEIIMRLLQMHPYTAYGKGSSTGKKNIGGKSERKEDAFDEAFDNGAERSFRSAKGYAEFRAMRSKLWPEEEQESSDESKEDDAEMKDMTASSAAARSRSRSPGKGRGREKEKSSSSARDASRSRSRGRRKGASGSAEVLNIRAERGIDAEILESVRYEMGRSRLGITGSMLVVSGRSWSCYVRCVLHHFGGIGRYRDVISALELQRIDLRDGVAIGGRQERDIQEIITRITGHEYYVTATDARSGDRDTSRRQRGDRVSLVLTGAHFSLLEED